MENVAVSIIIPVFNQEDFLEECLSSIINQTFKNYEIILVDDSSTDKTREIISKYQAKYNNIKCLLNSVCQGAGACRNSGLEVAQGKYVIFLDSDDFFDKKLLEIAYDACEAENLDIAFYQTATYDNETKEIQLLAPLRNKLLQENVKEVFNYKNFKGNIFNLFPIVPWNKLIKKEVIDKNEIRFQEIRHHNDVYFSCMLLMNAERMQFVSSQPLVFYRKNIKGQLTSNRSDNIGCAYNAIAAVHKGILDKGQFPFLQKAYVAKAKATLGDEYNKVNEYGKKELERRYKSGILKEIGLEEFLKGNDSEPYFTSLLSNSEHIIKKMFHDLQNKKIVLWGAGKRAEQFFETFTEAELYVDSVCDANELKEGQVMAGKTIKSIENALKDADCIFVLNSYFWDEIFETAKKVGSTNTWIIDVEYQMQWQGELKKAKRIL